MQTLKDSLSAEVLGLAPVIACIRTQSETGKPNLHFKQIALIHSLLQFQE